MMDRKLKRFWYRAGPLAACGALLTGGALAGCGSDSKTSSTGTGGETTTSTSSTNSTSTDGTGGAGGGLTTTSSTGTGGASALGIGLSVDIHRPFDAVLSPTGTQVYITADGANGLGVYKASLDSSAPKAVALYPAAPDDPNNPFAAPLGLAISTDGEQLFIADAATGTTDQGAIFAMAAEGGTPKLLTGTDGTSPHSLAVVDVGGKDTLYFTGTEAKVGGLPGVFSIPAGGGGVTAIATGLPLHDPSGIVVAKNGDIYLTDTIASASNTAQILVITSGGAPKVLVDDLRVGYPSGLALSLDEKTLYVSGYDAKTLTDRLIVVDVGEKSSTAMFATELGAFTEAAGLHRAKSADIFTFVDSSAGPSSGKVFLIK
jgi:hypothetical protein